MLLAGLERVRAPGRGLGLTLVTAVTPRDRNGETARPDWDTRSMLRLEDKWVWDSWIADDGERFDQAAR